MNTVTCPHCGKIIEISKALSHEILEKQRLEVEKARKEAQLEAEKTTTQKLHKEIEKLKKEKDEEAEKIKQHAQKIAEQELHLKLKAKDLQLEQIKKANEQIKRANEDLKRKLDQGSQQMQGEVLEVDIEEKLKTLFPYDEFFPIPKGVEGADIWQKVKYKNKVVGSIVWEIKRTKTWSNNWTVKLKDDAAKISASEAIIVSNVLPNGISDFDRRDGVWITSYTHAIKICRFVRFLITSLSHAKSSIKQTDDAWAKIRDYMISDSFKHKMIAHFEGIKALRENLNAEKRSTLVRWKKTENLIDKLDINTINFYAELKTIVPSLPEIKEPDVNILSDGQKEIEEVFN